MPLHTALHRTHQFSTAFTKVHHSATATLRLLHDEEE